MLLFENFFKCHPTQLNIKVPNIYFSLTLKLYISIIISYILFIGTKPFIKISEIFIALSTIFIDGFFKKTSILGKGN